MPRKQYALCQTERAKLLFKPPQINLSTCASSDNNSAYNDAEPTNIGDSYKFSDKYKEGKNNVKISTEHAYCTSAKEHTTINPGNEIKTKISFEHDYCSSTKETNPNPLNSGNKRANNITLEHAYFFFSRRACFSEFCR